MTPSRTKAEAERILAAELTQYGDILVATDRAWKVGESRKFNWGLPSWNWLATAVAAVSYEEFMARSIELTGDDAEYLASFIPDGSRFLRVVLD